jgi:hypothetical protein
MRAALSAVVVTGALIATVSALAGTSSETSLRITYWEDLAKPLARVTWTLRCDPAGGTLRRPARACTRLAAVGTEAFAPTPKNVVCTEIYGGPQKARIVGTVEGRRVWATFTRANGCEVERWSRISPWLVPPGGVT